MSLLLSAIIRIFSTINLCAIDYFSGCKWGDFNRPAILKIYEFHIQYTMDAPYTFSHAVEHIFLDGADIRNKIDEKPFTINFRHRPRSPKFEFESWVAAIDAVNIRFDNSAVDSAFVSTNFEISDAYPDLCAYQLARIRLASVLKCSRANIVSGAAPSDLA